jgi:hypothetical protein
MVQNATALHDYRKGVLGSIPLSALLSLSATQTLILILLILTKDI